MVNVRTLFTIMLYFVWYLVAMYSYNNMLGMIVKYVTVNTNVKAKVVYWHIHAWYVPNQRHHRRAGHVRPLSCLAGRWPWRLASLALLSLKVQQSSTYKVSTKPSSARSWLADNSIHCCCTTAAVDRMWCLAAGRECAHVKAARNERAKRPKRRKNLRINS